MKNACSYLLIPIVLLLSNIRPLDAQYTKVEEYTMFGNQMNSPIEMDVRTNGNKISFDVINRSFYPYLFEIKFDEFQNLTPRIFEKQTILHPGSNNLFTLSVVDENQSPGYSYSIKYMMGNPNDKPDLSFPYLIPIGKNKTVCFVTKNENGNIMLLVNQFKMNKNDTVFSSRKGWITALPDNKIKIDRISKSSSLEIRHSDGTVAVYIGLDPNMSNLELGQTVYPGQPIGKIGNSGVLTLDVYAFQGNGQLKNLDIYFADQNGQLISSRKIPDKVLAFPDTIIKKEMTKKEIKKYESGNLY
jgi:hypothetical protein